MSKKHRKVIVPSGRPRVTAPPSPAAVLHDAVRHLRRGEYMAVQERVESVLRPGLDPELASAGLSLFAEARFRAALASDDPAERLRHLDAALERAPDASKLHFYRGIALWQLGRTADALAEFDAVAAREPGRSGLAYLRGLAQLAAGATWLTEGLTPAEANTLRLVGGLVRKTGGELDTQGPLLGSGVELWPALTAMVADPVAAPAADLKAAAGQNMRKTVSRILHYYRGVAAARAGDTATARAAWLQAQAAGFAGRALDENLAALLREEAVALAQEERWGDVVKLVEGLPSPAAAGDRILAETASLAYYHLGYEAAQAGKWSQAARCWRHADGLATTRHVAQNLALAEEALENWIPAAEAWREMVRRRPRKADHPDYLTDAQVAALWNHAAECYLKAGEPDEAVTCYRNAIKYASDDAGLRLKLIDLLLDIDRPDAAESQILALLEAEPQNVEALLRLGRVSEENWRRDPMPIWRRVLAADPANADARDALANDYVSMTNAGSFTNLHLYALRQEGMRDIDLLEAGLKELPGHPKLLLALGSTHAHEGDPKQAREYLRRAFEAAPQDVRVADRVLHELLHAGAGDAAEALLPAVRQIPMLLPAFWLDQARTALECKLGEEWADAFIQEAVKLTGEAWVEDTPAGVLVEAYEIAFDSKARELADLLDKRIKDEHPLSGGTQYVQAVRANFAEGDASRAKRLMREAIRNAKRAGDQGVLRRAETIGNLLNGGPLAPELRRILEGMFPPDFV